MNFIQEMSPMADTPIIIQRLCVGTYKKSCKLDKSTYTAMNTRLLKMRK